MTDARESAAENQRRADTAMIRQRRAEQPPAPPAVATPAPEIDVAPIALVQRLAPFVSFAPASPFIAPELPQSLEALDAGAVEGAATPPPAGPTSAVWGLALSGGGIRSATVCLGVLQAIAAASATPSTKLPSPAPSPTPDDAAPLPPAGTLFRSSLLSRFDYLSTVSGGGYAGAFLCSLFLPGRLRVDQRKRRSAASTVSATMAGAAAAVPPELDPPATDEDLDDDDLDAAPPSHPPSHPDAAAQRAAHAAAAAAAADDAVRVLRHEPPGRLRGDGTYPPERLHEAPLAWLRDNGRYLAPSGGGDMLYAGSLAIRNWMAVHYVIGTLLLGVFASLAAVVEHVPLLRLIDGYSVGEALKGELVADRIWWSPVLALPVLVLGLWALPAGLAYWIPTFEGGKGRAAFLNRAFWGYVLIVAVIAGVWLGGFAPDDARWWLWGLGAAAIAIALVLYVVNRLRCDLVESLRVRMTRQLMWGLITTFVLVALALVDTAAHTLYLLLFRGQAGASHAVVPAGLGAAFIWLVQRIAKSADGFKPPAWLARLPWTVIGGAAGIAIFAITATVWAFVVVWMEWHGTRPDAVLVGAGTHGGMLVWLAIVMLALAALTGQFPSFINLSSLQSFYAARLTRAYLGASNGRRFRSPRARAARAESARHAAVRDRRKASVADPEQHDGIEVAEYLSRRNGTELATLAPLHLINVTLNNTVDPGEQLVQRDRKGQPLLVTPSGFTVDGKFSSFESRTPRYEIERTLSVGQWIGTSGAAFSTAIGRQTSLGLSLLLGAANVRLGTWWESGIGSDGAASWPVQALRATFKTQLYLVNEFTAKFHGLRRRWQYLSDGGHFENTALYELLRPSRGVDFVIACDNGADPAYEFADLANLIRLLRIDMGIELEVDTSVGEDEVLRKVIGVPEDFRAGRYPATGTATNGGAVEGSTARPEPVALLLKARPGGSDTPSSWVLMIKPRVWHGSAADVVQYALGHPAFPQEPTADQFFDEAQWESYRKLGRDNAAALLTPEVWDALHAHIRSASIAVPT